MTVPFYTYDRGELVATVTEARYAVAVAIAIGPGAAVSDESQLLLYIEDQPEWNDLAELVAEALLVQAHASVVDPKVIPISRLAREYPPDPPLE